MRHARLLTPEQVGEILQVAPRTLEGWRQRGAGPPHIRLNTRRIRYRAEDVDAWIDERRRASTAATRPPRQEVACG